MIVDTSALLAVLYQEEDAEQFVKAIVTAPVRRISAANFLEAAINIDAHGDLEASRQLDNFIRKANIEIAVITAEQAQIARQAYQDFGEGKHKAGLNFGDCFAYALARATGEPLLFKGNDFVYTDLVLHAATSSDEDDDPDASLGLPPG